MGIQITADSGGISGLRKLVAEHKEAIQYELLTRLGLHLWQVGPVLEWDEFRAFVNWLPPNPTSALYRSRFPKSWWVTPDVRQREKIAHILELANWQRAGGRKAGSAPKPPKLPEDRDPSVKSEDELVEKRRAAAEHLRRRREQRRRR